MKLECPSKTFLSHNILFGFDFQSAYIHKQVNRQHSKKIHMYSFI